MQQLLQRPRPKLALTNTSLRSCTLAQATDYLAATAPRRALAYIQQQISELAFYQLRTDILVVALRQAENVNRVNRRRASARRSRMGSGARLTNMLDVRLRSLEENGKSSL